MKIKLWPLIFCLISSLSYSNILIKQENMNLTNALNAVADDMKLKLVNNIDPRSQKLLITQTLKGSGTDILERLSKVYHFGWYVYGGILTVQSKQAFINYVYKPRNIEAANLLKEIKKSFKTDDRIKLELVQGKTSILFSGTRDFVEDAVGYATMIDKNEFLDKDNNLELTSIKFHYLSVVDRSIESYGNKVTFPGASSLVAAAITNIGQFQNISDGDAIKKAYKVKLNEGDKQKLVEQEKTYKVQPIPGSNVLLVRGTPEEIQLAKRIASLIDIKQNQIMFSLQVYDVSVENTKDLGLSFDGGTIGSLVVPAFTSTISFLKNIKALYSNGTARTVYNTNLLILENRQGHFGKKDTATVILQSQKEVKTDKIEADNSLYVTGRLLPSGSVQAKIAYIDQSLHDNDRGNTQTLSSEPQPPRVSSQSLDSEVYIKPGQTVILGGFDNTTVESLEKGIPILSSIPIIGNLFKSTKKIKRKYKRYISISFKVID